MQHGPRPRRREPRRRFGTRFFVATMILLVVAFTWRVLGISEAYGNAVPDSLVVAFFAFCTGEAFCMAGIKISDKRNGEDDESGE